MSARSPFVLLALGALVACTTPQIGERVDPGVAPSGTQFKPVAQVLLERCGSLDCHGSRYRNMRLWGFGAPRLDPVNQPDAPDTTQDEADHDYDAIVSLEPDIVRSVVSSGGKSPDRLTFVRKARGHEAHKGGQPITVGDPADMCILSWLAGSVDEKVCTSAVPRLANP
jgi:hypothetical protein